MTRGSFALPWLLLILYGGSAAVAQEETDGATPPSATASGAEPEAAAAAEPGAAPAPEEEGELIPTWYAQALARGPGGLNVTHFWSKGSKLRAETVIGGRKVVTLVNGDWYYAYDTTKGLGIRVRRTPEAIANDAPYRRPFGNEAVKLIKQGAEKIREEKVHGREAELYQLTDKLGRRMVWASKDALNVTLRIEMFNRRTAARQATDYIDWLTGLTLLDSYFDPDPNVEIKSYEFEEYAHWMGKVGTLGPVPVLYTDLLRGR